jgi:hypothetical protein
MKKLREGMKFIVGSKVVDNIGKEITANTQKIRLMDHAASAFRIGARQATASLASGVGPIAAAQGGLSTALYFMPPPIRAAIAIARTIAGAISTYRDAADAAVTSRASLHMAQTSSARVDRLRMGPLGQFNTQAVAEEQSRLRSYSVESAQKYLDSEQASIGALKNALGFTSERDKRLEERLNARKEAYEIARSMDVSLGEAESVSLAKVTEMDVRAVDKELSDRLHSGNIGAVYGSIWDRIVYAVEPGSYRAKLNKTAEHRTKQNLDRTQQEWMFSNRRIGEYMNDPRSAYGVLEDRRQNEWMNRLQRPRHAPLNRD